MIDNILHIVKSCLPESLADSVKIEVIENKSNYDSIVASADATTYRMSAPGRALIARVKLNGKTKYVSFGKDYMQLFKTAGIPIESPMSDGFCRMSVIDFLNTPVQALSPVITEIILKSFNYPSFDCCSRVEKCSDLMKCTHPDYLYACAACTYKKKLDEGIVFYGKNRNV